MSRQTLLDWGEAVPMFEAPTSFNPIYKYSSVGGYFSLLIVLPPLESDESDHFLSSFKAANVTETPNHPVAFAISREKAAWSDPRVKAAFPHNRIFFDESGLVLRGLGALKPDGSVRPHWLLVDPDLRVYAKGGVRQIPRLKSLVQGLPDRALHAGQPRHAPVLVMPRVLPKDFCDALVAHYRAGQVKRSGFMVQKGGKTVGELDNSFKRRFDVDITDHEMKVRLSDQLRKVLFPQIHKAFNFMPTRIERYIVACYRGDEEGFFSAHRDNTTMATAHRRFAVTINLNDDYEGGGVSFPEFGPTVYHAPKGGAVVFGCSLLHQAERVTKGERFATLPFLYDEAARAVRDKNAKYLDTSKSAYKILDEEEDDRRAG